MNSAVEDRTIPFGFHVGIQREKKAGGDDPVGLLRFDMLRTEEQ